MVLLASAGSIAKSVWNPVLLGYIQADGFGIKFGSVGVAVPVASGPTRYRQERGSNVNTAPGRSMFTAGRMMTFEYWYFRTLDRGRLWFSAPIKTGNGLGLFDCHFTESGYKAEFLGGREPPQLSYWQISFDWEFIYSEDNQPDFPDAVIDSRFKFASPTLDVVTGDETATTIIESGITV